MTYRSILLFGATLLLLSACGSTNTIQTAKADREMTIDGSISDWNTSATRIQAKDNANYYAAYDEDFIYIFIDIRDIRKDRAVRQSGLIVYLSDDEDRRRQVGIGVPPGTFNLLRENPQTYNNFIREADWTSKPENREILNRLEGELFDRVMIVEREDGRSNPEHGFVDFSQLEVDGIEIAMDTSSRFLSVEMKIPRDGSTIFPFSGDEVWLGFALETPNFRHSQSNEYEASQASRGGYGGASRQQRQPSSRDMSRALGEFDDWYLLQMGNND
ncbi:MAG: hypothetical protein JJU46_14610 [Balneolaceae bacterium]|nr:hypothetical protein [Balneolaceae bacterium]MCH8547525.1 hypothetical protein [Balneolaceae bacterium]